MRGFVFVISAGLLLFGASSAQAGGSCSSFAKIKSYDADAKALVVAVDKRGKERAFFPKTEGAPTTSKLPTRCKTKVMKADSFPVKPTGGRMSVTQIRANFSGKMLNDTDDPNWVPTHLQQLIDSGDTVVIVLRQPPTGGKDAPYQVTTIYLPVTEEELAEIARLDAQVVDE